MEGTAVWFDMAFNAALFIGVAYAVWSRGESPAKSAAGREELREIELILRALIGEASAASSTLDNRLQARKLELEGLLSRIEVTKRHAIKSLASEIELPNQTWEREVQQADLSDAELLSLIEEKQDQVSLSSSPLPRSSVKRKEVLQKVAKSPKASAIAQALRQQIEISKESTEISTSSVLEPSAYRIARRLLEAGKEIHVVARKLEVPVSEIRLIDRELRTARGEAMGAVVDEEEFVLGDEGEFSTINLSN